VPQPDLNFFSSFYKARTFGIKNINVFVYLLVGILSVDTVISAISYGLGINVFPNNNIIIFAASGIITIICQIMILQFVGRTSLSVRSKVKHIRRMHIGVSISQYIIIILFIYAIVEVVSAESYSPISSLLVTTLSYMLSIILMGIFTVIFLSWYKDNRSSILVLIYGLSFATVVIASISILVLWVHLFSEQMPPTLPVSDVHYLSTEEGSSWKNAVLIYTNSDITSFFLKWGGTVLILYHYSQRIGKVKFWVLLSLPLAYFSLIIIYHFHLYEPHEELETLLFFGFGSLNATFGGILFYLAFRIASKSFSSRHQALGDYLLMAGFGFMVFFSGSQGTVITTVYPPFGLATVASYGLGSYLILLGLYLSALSVSQDKNLRDTIKRSTLSESKFLHSIGMSAGERRKEIVNTVLEKAKQQQATIVKNIGIDTSLSEEDIKDYVNKVEKEEEKKAKKEEDRV
jgi:hypothetical protein